jgi:predicted ArsR family transcriptional regulator
MQCFGKYQNLPACDECVVGEDCLGFHLGHLTERGLVTEKFDPTMGQHVYSISEKGKEHLKKRLEKLG